MRVLLLTIFIIGLTWILLVPLWHFPDEQAHFGQVAFISENGRNPNGVEPDLTEEIYISERLLGTFRDKLGNNKFTFHPDYKIPYSASATGPYEEQLKNMPQQSKQRFVHQEATRYPPLYYKAASLLYRTITFTDVFTRVFAIRIFSLVLFLLTVLASVKIGRLLYGSTGIKAYALGALVGLQPMMMFANTGVNSDALGNLLFICFLLYSVKFIVGKYTMTHVFFFIALCYLAVITKPQFIIILPSVALLCLFILLQRRIHLKMFFLLAAAIAVAIVTAYLFRLNGFGSFILLDSLFQQKDYASFIKFTKEYTFSHTYREVLPWYWGIYDWLGVTYPRIVHRIINRIIAVSCLGLVIAVYVFWKKKRHCDKRTLAVVYLLAVQLLFFFGVAWYDWSSWHTSGFPVGIQGRYFFPFLPLHMILLLEGIRALLPKKYQLKEWGTIVLVFLMGLLNLYALYTISKTYYDISTFQTFIIQASQYKPAFTKGIFLTGAIVLSITGLIRFMTIMVHYAIPKK